MPEQARSNKVNNTTPLALSPTLPRGERDGASNAGIKGMRQPLRIMFVTLGRRVASRPRKGTLNRVLRSRSLARQSYGRQHCRNSHGTAERTLVWGVFVTQSRAGHFTPNKSPIEPHFLPHRRRLSRESSSGAGSPCWRIPSCLRGTRADPPPDPAQTARRPVRRAGGKNEAKAVQIRGRAPSA